MVHFSPVFTSKILSAQSAADLSIFYASFLATTAVLSSCDKAYGLWNLKYLLSIPPITESVCQPPTLKEIGWSQKPSPFSLTKKL